MGTSFCRIFVAEEDQEEFLDYDRVKPLTAEEQARLSEERARVSQERVNYYNKKFDKARPSNNFLRHTADVHRNLG